MIDTILAVFITGMLLLTLTSLLMAARVNGKRATENNVAYNAARQVIENVRIYRGMPLPVRSDYTKAEVLKLGDVPQIEFLANPDITMSIARWQDADGTFRDPVKIVHVTVSWRALGGTNGLKQRTFVSLVTPNGVVK